MNEIYYVQNLGVTMRILFNRSNSCETQKPQHYLDVQLCHDMKDDVAMTA